MAVQLLFCVFLPLGFVQNSMQHPCAVLISLFIQVIHLSPIDPTDMTTVWKNTHFILSERSGFHRVDNLSIAVHILPMHMSTFSVDEILLPKYMNWSTNFSSFPFHEEMTPS